MAAIDSGDVAVSAEGWVANQNSAAAFDDQVFLRVFYLDEGGERMGSLESVSGSGESWTLRALEAGLPPGTRALEVEVGGLYRHGIANESTVDAVSLMLWQRTPEPATITLAPMLQDHHTDQMMILWETDRADEPARIEWGADGVVASISTTQVADDHYVHRGTITGLSSGTPVDYRVCVGATCGEVYRFTSAPGAGAPVRIGWLADNQDNLESVFEIHIDHLRDKAPDMLIMAGDIVQDVAELEEWSRLWWRPLTDGGIGSSVPVMIARGNHDKEHPYAHAYAAMPGNGSWYSFRYGDIFFVVLDSNHSASATQTFENQQVFLLGALKTSDALAAAFRVVVFHDAPFNSIVTATKSSWGWEDAQEELVPLFADNGVDLVVAGHYHSYQRGERDGVRYVVIGGGGASLLGDEVGGPYEEMWAHVESSWHYSVMDADQSGLTWTTYGVDDAPIDSFTIAPR
ncbi:MAG: putative phosphodiesterase [Myxococcota bacterium]